MFSFVDNLWRAMGFDTNPRTFAGRYAPKIAFTVHVAINLFVLLAVHVRLLPFLFSFSLLGFVLIFFLRGFICTSNSRFFLSIACLCACFWAGLYDAADLCYPSVVRFVSGRPPAESDDFFFSKDPKDRAAYFAGLSIQHTADLFGRLGLVLLGIHGFLLLLSKERVHQVFHNEKNVNVSGTGNTVTVADYIDKIVNITRTTVEKSGADEEVKELISKIGDEFKNISSKIAAPLAEKLGKNLEALGKEIASEHPDKKWYELSIDGLKDAAVAIGEIGKPILGYVQDLIPLLLPPLS